MVEYVCTWWGTMLTGLLAIVAGIAVAGVAIYALFKLWRVGSYVAMRTPVINKMLDRGITVEASRIWGRVGVSLFILFLGCYGLVLIYAIGNRIAESLCGGG